MLSIVIPCYNEAVVIEKSVDKVIDFMKSIKVDFLYLAKNIEPQKSQNIIMTVIPL